MNKEKPLDEKFNKFIESGALDNNEFQEYETCIIDFDNKLAEEDLKNEK